MANSWRRERWDSLRLLTPNWQSRLPGLRYEGPDPDGYMTVGEVIEFIEHFAKVSGAPVRTGVNVTEVRPADDGYHVVTSRRRNPLPGPWSSRAAPATGRRCRPLREAVPASVRQLTTFGYRHPGQLPDGGVLVVGASATGVQLAAELRRSGRPVTLSVGEHVRLPRTYRGRDVLWWMDARACGTSGMTRSRTSPGPGGCRRPSSSGPRSG